MERQYPRAEWIGSILGDRPHLTAAVLVRTRAVMDRHFPDKKTLNDFPE